MEAAEGLWLRCALDVCVCVPTEWRCRTVELNHSLGGNCAENVCRGADFPRLDLRNNRDSKDNDFPVKLVIVTLYIQERL